MLKAGAARLENVEKDLLEEDLHLGLEVGLELHQKGQEDGEGQLEHLANVGDAVLGEGDAEVLLDGRDEHLVGLEDGPGVLHHREDQL